MAETPEFKPDLYTLTDEEGIEQEFELIDKMEYDGQTYYAFVPCDAEYSQEHIN